MAKGNKGKGDGTKVPVTQDERFKSVHNDPRFKLPNLKNFKVKVDSRFSEKELKKLNAGATGKQVKIDRYGRKIKTKDSDLSKYYEHEESESGSEGGSESGSEDESSDENEDDNNDEGAKAESKILSHESGSDSESESEDSSSETKGDTIVDKARGEGLESSSSDSSSDSDSSLDSDSDSFAEFEEEESEDEIEAKPEEGDPTSAFAVVNMDWDNIRAVDLMATFASFIPKGGLIKSIAIYPSEFGKEQMQKEEIEGPPKELFKSKKKKKQQKEEESDSDIDDIDLNNAEGLEKAAKKLYENDDGTEDYDSKALRRYQLQRLRYYYAVVHCDSVATAQNIYTNCDSTEFESTANIFDLRYVPEDMEFDESEAKDICTEVPSSYNPNASFVTDALQHSKVKLTWDETPRERVAVANRQFSQREVDEMDFKAYLASDSEESEGEKEDIKDKYKSLLGGKFSSSFDKKPQEDEDDVDMEITFNPGLDEKAVAEQQKREQELSTIEAYRQKEKERRKNRMAKMKEAQAAEKEATKEEKNNKKSHKKEQVDPKKKAELELLMMDENDDENKPEHFNMKDILKAEKQKNRKGKKHNKNIDNEMTQDNFEADLNDPRFKEIFENHEYAIDPTSSEFKKTQTMKKILKERSKRNKPHSMDKGSSKKQKTNDGSELTSLVDKLKRSHKK